MRAVIRCLTGKIDFSIPLLIVTCVFLVQVTFVGATNVISSLAVQERLERALSDFVGQQITIESIQSTASPELLEVRIAEGPVMYATTDGEFLLLNGDLMQVTLSGLYNHSEERRVVERLNLLNELDVGEMIVFSPDGESRDYITVFTDVTCGYCRKLHREINDFNRRGIEVRYLAYPRGGVNSAGAKQLVTAWCARNPQTVLTRLKSGVEVPMNECDENPIATHYALGNKLGVRGTPAILTSAGQMIPGYQPAESIAEVLGLD